jgi:hypothetical protein
MGRRGKHWGVGGSKNPIDELIGALSPLEGEYVAMQLGFYGNISELVEVLGRWRGAIQEAADMGDSSGR